MSYNNVGVSTARGSGTSGYVQSNRFQAKPKPALATAAASAGGSASVKGVVREIAEHERKRRVESELLVLSETLASQGYAEEEIAERVRLAAGCKEVLIEPTG